MSGTILYELHPHGENVFLLVGILLVLVVLLCGLAKGKTNATGRRKLFVPVAVLSLVLLLTSTVLLGDYRQLKSKVDRGNCRSVEGTVTAYRRGRNGRQTFETFTVGGVVFYNENSPESLPGYCLTGDTGGRLNSAISGDGQCLRITYVPDWPYRDRTVNCIVQIEERSDQRENE